MNSTRERDRSRSGKERNLIIWEVFEEYADIRDALEDLIEDFYSIEEEVGTAIMDLSDELNEIRERLFRCDKTFRRYKIQPEQC